MPRPRRIAVATRVPLVAVVTLVATGGLAACSSAPLPTDLEHAQLLEREGNGQPALEAWRAIRRGCERAGDRPRDDCGVAATREAQLLERLGKDQEAAAAWESVPSRTTDKAKASHALVRAATLALEKLADPARAETLAWRCVVEYPDEAPTDEALDLAVRVERRASPRALRDRLDQLARRFTKEEIADNLLFVAADLSARELADPAGAIARHDELAARFPRSALRDDALWRAAELLRKEGDAEGALERLRKILRTRKDAYFTGSYNSPLLDDAQLLVGRIERDDLHHLDRARDAFLALADDYPESILRDDALLELAATWLGASPEALRPVEGDAPSPIPRDATPEARAHACGALHRLATSFPDGNRAREGRELAARLGCS